MPKNRGHPFGWGASLAVARWCSAVSRIVVGRDNPQPAHAIVILAARPTTPGKASIDGQAGSPPLARCPRREPHLPLESAGTRPAVPDGFRLRSSFRPAPSSACRRGMKHESRKVLAATGAANRSENPPRCCQPSDFTLAALWPFRPRFRVQF